jgi:hypothetical protein
MAGAPNHKMLVIQVGLFQGVERFRLRLLVRTLHSKRHVNMYGK